MHSEWKMASGDSGVVAVYSRRTLTTSYERGRAKFSDVWLPNLNFWGCPDTYDARSCCATGLGRRTFRLWQIRVATRTRQKTLIYTCRKSGPDNILRSALETVAGVVDPPPTHTHTVLLHMHKPGLWPAAVKLPLKRWEIGYLFRYSFGHVAGMDGEVDTNRILNERPLDFWRSPPPSGPSRSTTDNWPPMTLGCCSQEVKLRIDLFRMLLASYGATHWCVLILDWIGSIPVPPSSK